MGDRSVERCIYVHSEIENGSSDRDYGSTQKNAETLTTSKIPQGFANHNFEESSWLCHPLLYNLP